MLSAMWNTVTENRQYVFVTLIVLFVTRWVLKIMQNRAPGPMAFPIVGNFPNLGAPGSPVHKIMFELSKKHGDVMSFWFGNKYTVVVSHYKYFHEALKKKGEDFAGRFLPDSMNVITRGVGVALQGDLKRWRKARTALLNGMTKKQQGERQVPIIMEEIQSTVVEFCKLYERKDSIPFRLHMKRESLNVVLRLCCDFRFSSRLSKSFNEIQAAIGTIFECISAGNPSDYISLAKLAGEPAVMKKLRAATAKRDAYIKEWVADHKKSLDKNRPRDFLDTMLIDQDKVGLTDSDIEVIVWDIMAGGIDTSATSIEWLIYILIKYPNVQKKAHEELDRVIGPNKLPTYEDVKERLPYINAIVLELFRFKHFAPFGIPHHTTKDTTLGGYNIPKNTQVMFNFHALHRDPRWWKKPEEFRPERFLEEDKFLSKSFINAESKPTLEHFKYLPFGHGKRMCVGFGLGRVVMLMKTAVHLHCFRFTAEDGSSNVDIETEHFGVTLVPEEQKIRVIPRPASKLCKSIEGDESICRNL